MAIFKKVLIVLLLIVIAFVVVVALQPSDFRVTRSATMAAPPARVFAAVNDFRQWEAWSPWVKLDPAATMTYAGPTAGEGASASQLGTTKRKDGTVQVTYAGHPHYTYAADKKPGEANGNDFSSYGAQWYALKGNGEEAGD